MTILSLLPNLLEHIAWPLKYYSFLDYLVEQKKFKYILVCNCCHQLEDFQDIQTGGFRPLSYKYFPLKKYNPTKLYNYNTKEVSIIEIK